MKNPTPVLLLPGLMNDERVWDPIRRSDSARRDMRVAATHNADTVAALATAAIEAMPHGRFAVAGFSLGGYVALEVCRQVPERIAGIALLDSGARADSDETIASRKRMVAALASGSASFLQIAGAFAPRLLHELHANDSQLIGLLSDMARCVGSEGFVRQQTAAMNRSDGRDVLRALRCPALVLCGRDDQITPPPLSEEMASLLTGNVELALIDRCGHMSTLEQPGAVAAAFARWMPCRREHAVIYRLLIPQRVSRETGFIELALERPRPPRLPKLGTKRPVTNVGSWPAAARFGTSLNDCRYTPVVRAVAVTSGAAGSSRLSSAMVRRMGWIDGLPSQLASTRRRTSDLRRRTK